MISSAPLPFGLQVDYRKPFMRGRKDPSQRAQTMTAFNSRKTSGVFLEGSANQLANSSLRNQACPSGTYAKHSKLADLSYGSANN